MYGFAVAASTSTKQLRFSKLPFLSSFFLLYLLNTLSLSPLTFCFEKTHFQEETIEAKIRKNVESECAKRQDALFLNVL